jgi:hypothetical protein
MFDDHVIGFAEILIDGLGQHLFMLVKDLIEEAEGPFAGFQGPGPSCLEVMALGFNQFIHTFKNSNYLFKRFSPISLNLLTCEIESDPPQADDAPPDGLYIHTVIDQERISRQ